MKILRPQDTQRGVTDSQILYDYARFIYPKEMTKSHLQEEKNAEIYSVYDSLYKFSLQKLNLFTTDACLNRMFSYYYLKEGKQRISENPTLAKYQRAYHEAAENLMKINNP
jgi:hypothetical protein